MPAKRKAASETSIATIGFEAKLWLAADKLRNKMDAAEILVGQEQRAWGARFGRAKRARRVRLRRKQPNQSNATTRRLALRGIEADIGKKHADTFRHVQHPDLLQLLRLVPHGNELTHMEYTIDGNQIKISLPITTPTGKVRVKRSVDGHAAIPVECCTVPIAQGDYLEWQISYDTMEAIALSVVPGVVLQKPHGTRCGYELVRLLVESRKIGALSDERFNELAQFVHDSFQSGIEEQEQIARVEDPDANTVATRFGFSLHYLHVPNYWRTGATYSVEVKIAAKQKAVGNQAMIFVNLPVEHCESQNGVPIIARCANSKEKIRFTVGAHNVDVVYDTIVAFAVASVAHRNDLIMIFDALARL